TRNRRTITARPRTRPTPGQGRMARPRRRQTCRRRATACRSLLIQTTEDGGRRAGERSRASWAEAKGRGGTLPPAGGGGGGQGGGRGRGWGGFLIAANKRPLPIPPRQGGEGGACGSAVASHADLGVLFGLERNAEVGPQRSLPRLRGRDREGAACRSLLIQTT